MSEQTIFGPPAGWLPSRQYGAVIERIRDGNGEWVRIDLSELSGAFNGAKQSRLIAAAKQRSIRVETTFRFDDCCYARMLPVSPSPAGVIRAATR